MATGGLPGLCADVLRMQDANIEAGAEVVVPGADIEKDVPDAAAFFLLDWNVKFPVQKDHHSCVHSLHRSVHLPYVLLHG